METTSEIISSHPLPVLSRCGTGVSRECVPKIPVPLMESSLLPQPAMAQTQVPLDSPLPRALYPLLPGRTPRLQI